MRADPASAAARRRREELRCLYDERDESWLRSTVPLAETELAHLADEG